MSLAIDVLGWVAAVAIVWWLWRRYGERGALGGTLGLLGLFAAASAWLRRPARDLQKYLDEGILPYPSEAKRRELAETLKSADAKLVEVRKSGGVEGLRAELKANRLDREGK